MSVKIDHQIAEEMILRDEVSDEALERPLLSPHSEGFQHFYMVLIASLVRPAICCEATQPRRGQASFLLGLLFSSAPWEVSAFLDPAGCRASDTNQSTRSGSAPPKQSFLRCSSLPKKVPLEHQLWPLMLGNCLRSIRLNIYVRGAQRWGVQYATSAVIL